MPRDQVDPDQLSRILGDINDRLSALEAQPVPASEQVSPSYLNINAQGQVTGIVTPGIILPAGTGGGGLFASSDNVVWQRSNGAVVASLTGLYTPGSAAIETAVGAQAPTDTAFAATTAYGSTGSEQASLIVQESGDGNGEVVIAVNEGVSGIVDFTVINAANQSSFAQLEGAPADTKISWGIFTTGTGNINNPGSGDWSLTGLGVGQATVNFAARAAAPAILATMDTPLGNNGWAQVANIGAASAIISTWTAAPALVNQIVSFLVIG